MNTRKILDDSTGLKSLSVEFNSDASLFAVGLERGFRIIDAEKCETVCKRDVGGGIGAAVVRDRSDCIALIGGGKYSKYSSNQVIIWNDTKRIAVLNLEFASAVQRVHLTRAYIVVSLLDSVILYDFVAPPRKLAEFDTARNPFGLCCLGAKTLAVPGRSHGQVRLVELANRNVSIIPAHSSSLRAMTLSLDGKFLATASENGTLIRVWSTSNCSKVAELRRGVDPAIIFSIAISPSSTLLAVTSDKSTLHLFDLSQFTQAAPLLTTQHFNIPGLPALSTPISPTSNNSTSNAPDLTSSFSSATTNRTHSKPSSNNDIETARKQKWGVLGKIPLMPRVFSDTYSFASVPFVIRDEPAPMSSRRANANQKPQSTTTSPSTSSWRPSKFNDWDADIDADIDADPDADTDADFDADFPATAPSHRSFQSTVSGAGAGSAAAAASSSSSYTSPSNIPGAPGGKPPKGQIGWLSDEQLVVVGAGQDSHWERFRIGVTDDGRHVCYREGWKRYLND